MLKVCLTGATGFIGRNLLKKLQQREDIEVIALSRKISPLMNNARKGNVTWRRCAGFSMLDVEKATEGADILIYLIHSMIPSTALSQGSFEDFDLYLADNFARAAQKNGIKKIIYLSGIIPNLETLSPHLLSRLEVEKTLSQYNNNLCVLRASLIVGPNGSSFQILERLIKRLPVLACPKWIKSKTQPIDLDDVLKSIIHCLGPAEHNNAAYDIAGPTIITYKQMLIETAKVLEMKKPIFDLPLVSAYLSRLWISKITSTPKNLVYPLVESLRHQMTADSSKQLIIPNHRYISFEESLRRSLKKEHGVWIRIITNYNSYISFKWLENVTSLQRISTPKVKNSHLVADEYFKWLPRFLKPFIQVSKHDSHVLFKLFNRWTLLKLGKSIERSQDDRVIYYIQGGFLARESSLNGRLEFRYIRSSDCVLIGLLDYRPALPWFVYKYTQALLHLFVMKRFQKHITS